MDDPFVRDSDAPENANPDSGKSVMLLVMAVGLVVLLALMYFVGQFAG